MYYVIVLEVRSPKWILLGLNQKCQLLLSLWRLKRRIHFIAFSSFRRPPAFPWLMCASSSVKPAIRCHQIPLFCPRLPSSSLLLTLLLHCFPDKDSLLLHWAHPDNPGKYPKIFNSITPKTIPFTM